MFLHVYSTIYMPKRPYIFRSICVSDQIREKGGEKNFLQEYLQLPVERKAMLLDVEFWQRRRGDRPLIALVRHRQRQQCRRNVEQVYVKTNFFV